MKVRILKSNNEGTDPNINKTNRYSQFGSMMSRAKVSKLENGNTQTGMARSQDSWTQNDQH